MSVNHDEPTESAMTPAEQRPTAPANIGTDEDRQAITRVIGDVEKGFNTNDPELSVEHFLADASVINAMGVHLSGWEALLEANRRGLAGFLKEEHARYRVDDIVFLRPDVALVYKLAWETDPAGTPRAADPSMLAQYVMVREHGRWWIAARANVLVRGGA